jgi:hypothetical protein
MRLTCGEKPLLEGDRAFCGFGGRAADVTFYSTEEVIRTGGSSPRTNISRTAPGSAESQSG